MSTDAKCPFTESNPPPKENPMGFDNVIPEIFSTIKKTIAESASTEAEKKEIMDIAEDSEMYYLVQTAFIAGVKWSLRVPPLVAITEDANHDRKMKMRRTMQDANDILASRPDEMPQPSN